MEFLYSFNFDPIQFTFVGIIGFSGSNITIQIGIHDNQDVIVVVPIDDHKDSRDREWVVPFLSQ